MGTITAINVVRLGHLVECFILSLVHEQLRVLHDGRLVAESIANLLPLILLVGLENHVAWGGCGTLSMLNWRRWSHCRYERSVA